MILKPKKKIIQDHMKKSYNCRNRNKSNILKVPSQKKKQHFEGELNDINNINRFLSKINNINRSILLFFFKVW